jgi:hypothetical protein
MNRFPLVPLLMGLAMPLAAQPLVPSPSVPDLTRDDGWIFALGAEVEYGGEYDGSDDYGVEIEPALLVQWRSADQMLFLEGQELGWRMVADEQWMLQAGLRWEGGREESEAPALKGMGDVDDELVGVLEGRYAFDGDWSNWVAHAHVRRLLRRGQRLELELATGLRIPVSRRNQRKVNQWYGRDAKAIDFQPSHSGTE